MKYVLSILLFLFLSISTAAQVITGGIEQVEDKDKITAYFSDGSYGVRYKTNPLIVLYYDSQNVLTHTEKRTSLEYPYNSYKYDANGKLVVITLRLSEDETLIYDTKGKMIAHWIGANCYNSAGNIIMTRNFEY